MIVKRYIVVTEIVTELINGNSVRKQTITMSLLRAVLKPFSLMFNLGTAVYYLK